MRHLSFDRLHNFRDLGGYLGEGGRPVRWGRLYRADSLGKLAGADLDRFTALGVRTVVDLRYPWEVTRDGRVPVELDYHNLSVEHRPWDQAALSSSTPVGRILADRYAEVLSLVGVAADDIVADYALTGLATDRLVAEWRAKYGDRGPLWRGYGHAPADAMTMVLADLTATYGSVRDYVRSTLGVTDPVVTTLRERLLAR